MTTAAPSAAVKCGCASRATGLGLDHVDELFVQPAAGDSGTSLGAATYVANERGEKIQRMDHVYLGPSYGLDECRSALEDCREPVEFNKLDDVPAQTAELLAAGNPVAWFQGRMEFGPRALGARSIIGDPRNSEMQTVMNLKIKYRESFRPFAPSVLAERVSDYFEQDVESPYMLIVAPVRKELRRELSDEEQALRSFWHRVISP